MQRPLGAQISHMLKDRGVDVIFGIPGVHNQEMYRGIEEAGITHILARHEQGAGFMADGYARASGKPGVAYVITGPGLCNIMTPMGQAYSDSVPMLVISSCLDDVAATKGQLHQMKDQRAAAETVCDWSEEARSASAAYRLIDRALVEFLTDRKRPKHIQVPIALLQAQAAPAIARPAPTAPRTPPRSSRNLLEGVQRPSLGAQQIKSLARRIMEAERPLLIFGGGAATPGVESLVSSVLAKSKAASFTTYAGRGVVAPDNPRAFGASLARPESATLLKSSDCVIYLGTDLAEVDLWRSDPGHRAGAVHINLDPTVLAAADADDTRLQADAVDALAAIEGAFAGVPASRWSSEIVADYRARWRAEVDAERPGIVAICDALRAVVPPDTMIYSDMTQLAYVAKEVWDMDRACHWHHPYGFGTLGYATPAAIGGAIARAGQPTMAIIGDYGFHYTMQELGVAVELGLRIPIILWDNGKLKEIEESMVRAQIAPNAVIARNPDFCRLAEAFGARAAAPKSIEALQSAVTEAFAADGPTLICISPGLTG
ncbi:thiamine pyrophosphate-binding protein [Roseobacter sinensis]|uniref:Thiamine pyrophosphate-binding protein n=1 Tax=Roseobacter sinensis TaxID=2931391 RepID=A0ABT3BAD7_9RHOB|nr:thiamine pyrophosphate-binding protein [Roseobacter sp. WL0113]MCV3270369.1 thiamine pyrophosphate-binding protein [Roseobacter sp. WL0113]